MRSSIPFVFWATEAGEDTIPRFWTHDNETCRLAAALEGYDLVRHTTGDNEKAVCRLCGKRFITAVVDDEANRS